MKSRTTKGFWQFYEKLPVEVQKQAYEAYKLFETDPSHPSLNFKLTKPHSNGVWSVRAGSRTYRAFGTLVETDTILWFWIGHHKIQDEELDDSKNLKKKARNIREKFKGK